MKPLGVFTLHGAMDRSARKVVIPGNREWTVFAGIVSFYLALAIFAIAAGGPSDPGALGPSP